ncbi:hypothetical protein ONR75_11470 [Rhodopseudomonas sp. P2A-2r]|uniref:hypothetical protein n=1 Tax=Rhodopseudomonas sp. P2A-2r TaxID=2991972 RepID=UPI00223431E2|nr:hypothetical protein [Rhodopseudomonas sp. P2A-2r]UZE51174.1 hypothetical protein ONR75_11470 [Rhodopseudomonas sp. P2A-2r]
MSRHPSDALFARIGAYGKALPGLLAWLLRKLVTGPAAYHPGAHYMRGPGPKWREKHGLQWPGAARDQWDA